MKRQRLLPLKILRLKSPRGVLPRGNYVLYGLSRAEAKLLHKDGFVTIKPQYLSEFEVIYTQKTGGKKLDYFRSKNSLGTNLPKSRARVYVASDGQREKG